MKKLVAMQKALLKFINHYRVFEFSTIDRGILPTPPTINERYLYAQRHINFFMVASTISFVCVTISMMNFVFNHPFLWVLLLFLGLNIIYFIVSFIVNYRTDDFDLEHHRWNVRNWRPSSYPTIDVFLPTAGEDVRVIENTWKGVQAMATAYKGVVTVYALDDGDSAELRQLAKRYGYNYEVRPDRGYYKKAGNLRHGFSVSKSDFIVIFDADFTPTKDFLYETLPYFRQKSVGIVQTPQYFSVNLSQNWLERGAGAVQELFYRFSQVSRQSNDASICVGSNAVYRREALNSTGGTALIEHSEDVHTGFNIRMHGWKVLYIPIILATGLCPSTMQAFFKQQYRWCLGSMSLLSSAKFWQMKLRHKTRMSYMSGFLYYIHTGLMSIYVPVVPLILLIFLHEKIVIMNYLLVLPAFIFSQIIYPLWHKSLYGVEAWATKTVYSWAHLFAITDHIIGRPMGWQSTGSKTRKNYRYTMFRLFQALFNFVPGVLWVVLAASHLISTDNIGYAPMLVSGIYYLLIAAKITFHYERSMPQVKLKPHLVVAT